MIGLGPTPVVTGLSLSTDEEQKRKWCEDKTTSNGWTQPTP